MNEPLNALLPADFHPLTADQLTADSVEALSRISAAAAETNAPGQLTPVGLVIIPAAFDGGTGPGLREGELPALAPRLRGMPGVTVRGCVVRPDLAGADGARIAAAFHQVYQTGKRLSALLPCAMPFLGFGGMLEPIRSCIREDPAGAELIRTAAEIVAMQNRTAFYAKLLID